MTHEDSPVEAVPCSEEDATSFAGFSSFGHDQSFDFM